MSEKREPGYYWVKVKGVADPYIFYCNSFSDFVYNGDLLEENFIEEVIGSRITPEMKYTEEDMKKFGQFMTNNVPEGIDRLFDKWEEERGKQ